MKKKNLITVAIDSPAAAGAGTQAKLISKHYNLFYLDTGKIYRYIGQLKINNPFMWSEAILKDFFNQVMSIWHAHCKVFPIIIIIVEHKGIKDEYHRDTPYCQ